jgi:hypothetical protein
VPFRTCVPWYCSSPPYRYTIYNDYIGYPATGSVIPAETSACPTTMEQAWDLLARRFRDEALDAFLCHIDENPDDGLPRLGYAIAAALLGEEDAITAMRDVMRLDPEAMLYVPDDPRLNEQLEPLARGFDRRARESLRDLDALFMVAALRFLLGEFNEAHFAVDVGIALGDADPAALNLQALIEAAKEDATAEPGPAPAAPTPTAPPGEEAPRLELPFPTSAPDGG